MPSTGSGTEIRIENVPSTTLRHRVIKDLVAEPVEATVCRFFVFVLITQSSRRFVEMMAFLSSQRNIRDVLWITRILMQ